MRPGPRVKRPTLLDFTPESGKAWLAGEKSRLMESSNPGDLIAMNDAAAAISRGSFAGSKKALEDVLSKAAVYAWDRKPGRDFQRGEGRLVVNVRPQAGRRELSVGGFVVRNLEELASVEEAFRRNKPFYRAAQRYFRGELSPAEEARLRSALSALSFVRHQGGAHSL